MGLEEELRMIEGVAYSKKELQNASIRDTNEQYNGMHIFKKENERYLMKPINDGYRLYLKVYTNEGTQ